jgi:hypothetical protein
MQRLREMASQVVYAAKCSTKITASIKNDLITDGYLTFRRLRRANVARANGELERSHFKSIFHDGILDAALYLRHQPRPSGARRPMQDVAGSRRPQSVSHCSSASVRTPPGLNLSETSPAFLS